MTYEEAGCVNDDNSFAQPKNNTRDQTLGGSVQTRVQEAMRPELSKAAQTRNLQDLLEPEIFSYPLSGCLSFNKIRNCNGFNIQGR